jgi:hypothetical protein
MKTVFYLLLRLICYPAFVIAVAAGVALLIVRVNGQCSAIGEMGVTCVSKFSQRLADFGFAVATFTLDTGFLIVLAVGGLIFLMRDTKRYFSRAPS